MILPFSTQINGKPTYFVEKISLSMLPIKYVHPKYGTQILKDWTDVDYRNAFLSFLNPTKTDKERLRFQDKLTYMVNEFLKPKLHTIREDSKDRWKAGNKIDFFINCRQKDMFRFAPVLQVVSVQKIEIIITKNCGIRKRQVWIDDVFSLYYEYGDSIIDKGLLQLAQNDGFDSIEEFFTYFDKDFTGKLIHWTDLRY